MSSSDSTRAGAWHAGLNASALHSPSPSVEAIPYTNVLGSFNIVLVLVTCFSTICYLILLVQSSLDAFSSSAAYRLLPFAAAFSTPGCALSQDIQYEQPFRESWLAVRSYCTQPYVSWRFACQILQADPFTISSNDDTFLGMGAEEDHWNIFLGIAAILIWFDSLQYMLSSGIMAGSSSQANSVLLLKRSMVKVVHGCVCRARLCWVHCIWREPFRLSGADLVIERRRHTFCDAERG